MEKYNVVFYGKIFPEQTLVDVKRKIATLYKIDLSKVEQRFFSKKPFVVKANVDRQTAIKYQKLIESTGAQCEIKKCITPNTGSQTTQSGITAWN